FHADLGAGALLHGFAHVVAGALGVEAVDPAYQLAVGLGFEVGLAVEGPAHEPGGVLDGHDAAGDHLARVGVPAADLLHIGCDAVIQQGDGGGFPLGGFDVGAEDLRASEGRVLHGDVLPQFPA